MNNTDINSREIKALYKLINQHVETKILMLACEIKLDEILGDDWHDIEKISNYYEYNQEAFCRYLKILEAHKIVIITQNRIAIGELGRYLKYARSPHLINSYNLIGNIEYSLRHNKENHSEVYQKSCYEYIASDPTRQENFNSWSSDSLQSWILPTVMNNYNFSNYSCIIEVNGDGYLLQHIIQKKIVNNELNVSGQLLSPRVKKEKAKSIIAEQKLQEYINVVENYNDINTSADGKGLFIFFRTLLALSPHEVLEKLNYIYDLMPDLGKVLVIDFYIPEKNHEDYILSLIADMNILTCLGGGLRTKKDWQNLVVESKFGSHYKMIESTNNSTNGIVPVLPILMLECWK